MKSPVSFFICFVIAFFLGRWTPSYDLQLAQLQIRNLEDKIAQNEQGSGPQITSMLGLRKGNERRRSDVPKLAETNTPTLQAVIKDKPVPRENRFDDAIELWDMRTRLARTSFIERLGADKEAVMNFDVLMEALNLRTEATISNWVARVEEQQGQISSEDSIRMVNEILDWVVLTYDEMDRKLPANWREGVGNEFQLIEMIDPRVATPLLRIENRLSEVEF